MELSLIKEQILLGHLPNFHKEIQAKILGTEGNLELQNQLRHFSLESLILISIQPKKKIFYTKIHPLENMALGALRNSFTIIDINANINKSTDEVAANNEEILQYLKTAAGNRDSKACDVLLCKHS